MVYFQLLGKCLYVFAVFVTGLRSFFVYVVFESVFLAQIYFIVFVLGVG